MIPNNLTDWRAVFLIVLTWSDSKYQNQQLYWIIVIVLRGQANKIRLNTHLRCLTNKEVIFYSYRFYTKNYMFRLIITN